MKLTIKLDNPHASSEEVAAAINRMVHQLPELNSAISTDFACSEAIDPTAKSVNVLHHVVEIIIQAGQVAAALKSIHDFLKISFPEGLQGTVVAEFAEKTLSLGSKDIAETIGTLEDKI